MQNIDDLRFRSRTFYSFYLFEILLFWFLVRCAPSWFFRLDLVLSDSSVIMLFLDTSHSAHNLRTYGVFRRYLFLRESIISLSRVCLYFARQLNWSYTDICHSRQLSFNKRGQPLLWDPNCDFKKPTEHCPPNYYLTSYNSINLLIPGRSLYYVHT